MQPSGQYESAAPELGIRRDAPRRIVANTSLTRVTKFSFGVVQQLGSDVGGEGILLTWSGVLGSAQAAIAVLLLSATIPTSSLLYTA
jgi:hypothetical protein